MQLVMVGVNFKSAPLSVRERLAFAPADLPGFYEKLRERAPEGFVLSTCNRTEVYALAGHADSGAAALLDLLGESRSVEVGHVSPYFYRKSFDQAITHLFSVASGVDSMVPGEEQILGQLRAALESATRAGALGPVLHRLGASALSIGKNVRSETGISRHSLSLVSVALQAAAAESGSLSDRSVLVVGAGHTARLAVRHLERANAKITICNRSVMHANELAGRSSAKIAPWEALDHALVAADVVVSCTNAPNIVIDRQMVEEAMVMRPERPMLMVDLAVPHDIDPEAQAIEGVRLIGMNALESLSAGNRRSREGEIARADALIAVAMERFLTWWNARQVAPTITSMLAHANQIRDQETERALARMPELNECQRELIQMLGGRIIAQLLHNPMRVLKTHPEGANLGWAVQQLFNLQGHEFVTGPDGRPYVAKEPGKDEPEQQCKHDVIVEQER